MTRKTYGGLTMMLAVCAVVCMAGGLFAGQSNNSISFDQEYYVKGKPIQIKLSVGDGWKYVMTSCTPENAVNIGTVNGESLNNSYTFDSDSHVGEIQVIGQFVPLNPGDPSETAYSGSISATVFDVELGITYPLTNQNNGTFTSKSGEKNITVQASINPSIPNALMVWDITDDDRDSIDSGDPQNPENGMNCTFIANQGSTSSPRNAPLSYKIKATLALDGTSTNVFQETYARQDELDQLRQEYIDLSRFTPMLQPRNQFSSSLSTNNYMTSSWRSWGLDAIPSGHSSKLTSIHGHLQHNSSSGTISSGYRPPRDQLRVETTSCNYCAHVRGEAMDLNTADFNGDGNINHTDRSLLRQACINEGATYTQVYSTTLHVHADWR